jgi:uncharacterized membrane protein YdjX (TVP38/TMEM64 family)
MAKSGRDAQEDTTSHRSRRNGRPRALVGLLVIGIVAAALGLNRVVSPEVLLGHYESLRALVDGHGWRALLAYMAAYATVVSLSVPGSALMSVLGGLLFGWALGASAALVAATTGAVVIFLVARTTLGAWLARAAGPRLQRIAAGLREDAANYLLFLRFVPIFPFVLVNLAPALFGVRLRTFFWTTAVGIIPATLALATAGAGLDHVVRTEKAALDACLAAGEADCRFNISLKSLISTEMLVAFAALGLLALIPVAARRLVSSWSRGGR